MEGVDLPFLKQPARLLTLAAALTGKGPLRRPSQYHDVLEFRLRSRPAGKIYDIVSAWIGSRCIFLAQTQHRGHHRLLPKIIDQVLKLFLEVRLLHEPSFQMRGDAKVKARPPSPFRGAGGPNRS